MMIGAIEDEGDESRASGNNCVAKLAGKIVAEGSGAYLGDGEAAGGDDESGRAKFVGAGAKEELSSAADFVDARVEEDLDVSGATFGFEKVGDVRGGIVAKELAEGFFVVGDAMLIHKS